MAVCIENPKESKKQTKILKTGTSDFNKVKDARSKHKNQSHFYTNNKHGKTDIKNNTSYNHCKENT